MCHLCKKVYILSRYRTVALQVQPQLGEQLAKRAAVVILYWLKIQERKMIMESHGNLSLLLPALQQLFMKVCRLSVLIHKTRLPNSAQYVAFDNRTNLDPILI